ncbi:hypothetical protein LOK49_LG02G01317 [Camellia lanceoleosa]|uniref:Uncharacterized protein n=1 Tax=Camellia lanceoleosa TaxID=1840588 RepID=A0ACC0IHP9_9ERIC|nr:hypothetical protein LOK49_LG02G01317 [Camellia lanceoleosa]
MASISSILFPNLLQQHLTKPFTIPQQPNSKLSLHSSNLLTLLQFLLASQSHIWVPTLRNPNGCPPDC